MASSVYISQAAQDERRLSPAHASNLQFLVHAMEAIGRVHAITQSFLRQVLRDLRRVGLDGVVRSTTLARRSAADEAAADESDRAGTAACGHNIPLFARSRHSKRAGILPPLPGRLPLANPVGRPPRVATVATGANLDRWAGGDGDGDDGNGGGGGASNKRRRVAQSPSGLNNSVSTQPLPDSAPYGPMQWFSPGLVEEVSSSSDNNNNSNTTPPSAGCGGASSSSTCGTAADYANNINNNDTNRFRLPHRGGGGGCPSSSSATATPTPTTSNSSPSAANNSHSGSTPAEGGPVVLTTADGPGGADMDLGLFQGLNSWGDTIAATAAAVAGGDGQQQQQDPSTAAALYAQMADGGILDDDSWMMLNNAGIVVVDDGGGGGGVSWGVGAGVGGRGVR